MTTTNICYLKLAQHLAGTPINTSIEEAKFRTIESRAYYSCYHEALALLARLNVPIPNTGSFHKRLTKALQVAQPSVPNHHLVNFNKAYSNFVNLKNRRVTADYYFNIPITSGHMQQTLQLAQSTFSIFSAI